MDFVRVKLHGISAGGRYMGLVRENVTYMSRLGRVKGASKARPGRVSRVKGASKARQSRVKVALWVTWD